MGIISTLKLEFDTYPPNRIMKLCLLAIALVAGVIAEPESKPWLYRGYGGYVLVMVMLVTEDFMEDMDTTLESDLLMLMLSQKANHGCTVVTEDFMEDTDTTLESDLLMLNPKARLNLIHTCR